MRTINLHFTQEQLEAIANYLYVKGCEKHSLDNAIGYLSLWGLNYPVVDIYLRGPLDGEFMACYRTATLVEGADNVKPAYVIGAIFDQHTKKYGFHS